MAVRGVDDEHVHMCVDERGGALERVATHADRGAHAQAARASPCTRSGI